MSKRNKSIGEICEMVRAGDLDLPKASDVDFAPMSMWRQSDWYRYSKEIKSLLVRRNTKDYAVILQEIMLERLAFGQRGDAIISEPKHAATSCEAMCMDID